MKNKPTPTNRFSVKVAINFPLDSNHLLRWFNLQNCGKETIPLNEKVSSSHKKHAYNLRRGRVYDFVFEITKEGEWIYVGRKC